MVHSNHPGGDFTESTPEFYILEIPKDLVRSDDPLPRLLEER